MILFLDKISVLQSRKLRNQILDVLILIETIIIASQNSDHNLIKQQSKKTEIFCLIYKKCNLVLTHSIYIRNDSFEMKKHIQN